MIKYKSLLNYIVVVVLLLIAYLSPNFPYNWTETTQQDFQDGYFYRSTVTADGKLKIRQWDDWWNTDWPHRIPIEINTTGISETLYDYQIWFITNTKALVDDGKLDINGTAIRIAGPDGKTLIPFWVETWNVRTSTGSKIWVKVPQIPPNTISYIYMYIRNVSTNSLSNRDAVFDLYENWETGTIRSQTPWSDTGWVMGSNVGNYIFEIHRSTDVLSHTQHEIHPYSTGTVSVYEGNYCVRSGTIPHAPGGQVQEAIVYLQTLLQLTYSARAEFYWSCYSEGGNYDYLSFFVGATEKGRIGGHTGWTFAGFDIPSGTQMLRWQYRKDTSGFACFDRGFVDRIVVRKYNIVLETQLSQRIIVRPAEIWTQYYK
ncbi:MAG: DUF2341 domain-containing protein, partial [Endomicrobia bacterium]|nr:DUF2341 domain-containing protein [Endomicrobiia bacterium]